MSFSVYTQTAKQSFLKIISLEGAFLNAQSFCNLKNRLHADERLQRKSYLCKKKIKIATYHKALILRGV